MSNQEQGGTTSPDEGSEIHFQIDVKSLGPDDIERIQSEVAARIAKELQDASVEEQCSFGSHYDVVCN